MINRSKSAKMTGAEKIVFIPLVIVLLVIFFFVFVPVLNDITLDIFAEQLYKYPLPQNTEIIEKKKVCGKLNGNGNGMDFFACILIRSDLPLNEIKEYYNDAEFKTAKPEGTESGYIVYMDVIKSTGYNLQTEYVEHAEINFESLKNETDISKYYIVTIFDGGYTEDFDLRGH